MKIFISCILASIIIAITSIFTLRYIYGHRNYLEYVECTDGFEYINVYYKPVNITREEARVKIEALFGNPKYKYKEKQIERPYSNILFKTVVVPQDTGINHYIYSLTHELVHLTERTGCERYVEFRTFQILYESGDADLKIVADEIANKCYFKQCDKDYQCWYYIYNYLKGE